MSRRKISLSYSPPNVPPRAEARVSGRVLSNCHSATWDDFVILTVKPRTWLFVTLNDTAALEGWSLQGDEVDEVDTPPFAIPTETRFATVRFVTL